MELEYWIFDLTTCSAPKTSEVVRILNPVKTGVSGMRARSCTWTSHEKHSHVIGRGWTDSHLTIVDLAPSSNRRDRRWKRCSCSWLISKIDFPKKNTRPISAEEKSGKSGTETSCNMPGQKAKRKNTMDGMDTMEIN